jgi:hypothetical protein
MRSVLIVDEAFFPLDEELALLSGALTPTLQDGLARLGSWLPFARAAELLFVLCKVQVSEATARRQSEQAGAAYVAVQEEEVEHLLKELPAAPPGPDKQLLSVDGAMVPLVGGEWTEAKTLVLGVIEERRGKQREQGVHVRELSYFSRVSEASEFQRAALVETQRRGVENAGCVIAPLDGAEWEQKFLDYHRADAVRILDFAHAAEYLGKIGAALWGLGTPTTQAWLNATLHTLKEEGPAAVLPKVRALLTSGAPSADALGCLEYLEKREAQMRYPLYQAQGWPIGSGAVESANKVVVEARLKGAGMHWARTHVNPMLGLRNAVCNDRWAEAWPQISNHRRQEQGQRREARYQQRHAPLSLSIPQQDVPGNSLSGAVTFTAVSVQPPPASVSPAADPVSQTALPRQPWRPPPNHPWRKFRFGKSRFQKTPAKSTAKL